jgi:Homeodomain-like domain
MIVCSWPSWDRGGSVADLGVELLLPPQEDFVRPASTISSAPRPAGWWWVALDLPGLPRPWTAAVIGRAHPRSLASWAAVAQVARAADAFGFSRQSFYATQAALDEGGLPALVPRRPGPRRAHKLSHEVLAFCQERLESDPELKPKDLAAQIAERFGVQVHPRSIERALARQEAGARSPKSD